MKGSEFLKTIEKMSASPERDTLVLEAVRHGGMVPWPLVEVPLDKNRGFFRATTDYLAIGEYPADWVRVPVGGKAAQEIADMVGAVLPTAYMVDLIWRASTRLPPQPYQDLRAMTSTRRFVEHHARIEKTRAGRDGLLAGHKKDVVISNKLEQKPKATAIYGWHTADGNPIQPVSTHHEQPWYSDYSHGIRLIAPEMVLDGKPVRVVDVLRDPALAEVLTGGKAFDAKRKTNDAVMRVVRYPSAGAGPTAPAPAPANPAQARPQNAPSALASLGDRCTDWCLSEMGKGVAEDPPGSSTGPRIKQYFEAARRRGSEQLLGISQGDWCAVAQSAALASVAQPGEPVPHAYRAAVRELREDAQQSGAWVPIDVVRRGEYQIRRGDLLVFRRGNVAAGLGHVARVDTPPNQGVVVAIGANEDNTWRRRSRSLLDPELEGIIRFAELPATFTADVLRTGLKASDKPSIEQVSLAPAGPATPAKGADERVEQILTVDGWMRFEEDYLPRVVTGENGHAHPEALKAQAVASRTYVLRAMRDDRSLGRTVPVPNSQKFQVYSRSAFPQCIAAVEATRGEVARYEGRLIIANYVAGALWTNGRPGNDPTNTEKWVTYNEGRSGKAVSPTKLSLTSRSDNRGCMSQNGADWLARNGRSYHEILRFFYGADIELGTKGATEQLSQTGPAAQVEAPPQARHKPAKGLQKGVSALVSSRRRGPTVGGSLEAQVANVHQRLDRMGDQMAAAQKECDETDAIFAATMGGPVDRSILPAQLSMMAQAQALHARLLQLEKRWKQPAMTTAGGEVAVGVAPNNTVLDQAHRVDDYIRALAQIIKEEREKRQQPDGFPWWEWAAYRVSWDEALFRIKTGAILWTDDTIVHEYELLSKEWANVVEHHYGRRPESPTIDRSKKGPWKTLGVIAVGAAATAVGVAVITRR